MNDLNSRVAYLKGLAEGLGLDEEKRESKLFRAIIDVLAEMAEAIGRLRDDYDDLTDYAEAIDQDLNDLEDDFYDDGNRKNTTMTGRRRDVFRRMPRMP